MAALSAVSYMKAGGTNPIIVVSTPYEELIVKRIDNRINVLVVAIDIGKYPKISYKNFCLVEVFKLGIFQKNEFLIICDSDVVWWKFDQRKFMELKTDLWFQRVSYYNSRLLMSRIPFIPRRDVAVRTLRNASRYIKCERPLDVVVNAGLYGGSFEVLEKLTQEFYLSTIKIPPRKVKLSESLLSFVIPNMNLSVSTDTIDLNIKYRIGKKIVRVRTDSQHFQKGLDLLRTRNPIMNRVIYNHDFSLSGRMMASHFFAGRDFEFQQAIRRALQR